MSRQAWLERALAARAELEALPSGAHIAIGGERFSRDGRDWQSDAFRGFSHWKLACRIASGQELEILEGPGPGRCYRLHGTAERAA